MLERLQSLVLAWLPREFRDAFGAEMLAAARAIDAERPRRPRRILHAITDIFTTPFALRAELRREARHRHAAPRPLIMESLLRDLQYALRGLTRDRAFTAFCLVTLALGIGANAAMFGIADRLLLGGPDRVRESNRVVRLYATTKNPGMRAFTTDGFGYVTYDLMRQNAHSFSGVATYAINDVVLGSGSEARTVKVGYATAGLFPLLGVQPARGRFFSESEDAPTSPQHVAVLSDTASRAWFGDDDALGRTIVLNDESFNVIGVAPHGFTGPQFGRVDVWVPGTLVGQRTTQNWQKSWNAQWLAVVARLQPGVTFDQAAQEITTIYRAGYTGNDDADKQAQLTVASLRANHSGEESVDLRVLRWLTGVSAAVLLIACANVANLLLARGLRRSREVAIRAALGAGRSRLVRLLLLEALVLAMGGASLGVLIAYNVSVTARRILFTSVDWPAAPINARVLVVSIVIALITGLLIGLVPALRSTRSNLTDALKTGVREGGGHRSRLRTSLTIAQAAVSVLLLVGAGLFVRSLWHAYTLDFGFDPDRVTVVEVTRQSLNRLPTGPLRDAERNRRRSFYFDVLDRVRTIPGVEQASVAVGTPFGNQFSMELRAEGVDEIPRLAGGGPGLSAVTATYFDTMGTSVIRGRTFTSDDRAGSEPVAIVSALMASTIWPGADPIGKCLFIGRGTPPVPPATEPTPPPCSRIVGVAENTYRNRLREDPAMHFYIPAGQETNLGFGGAALLVRTRKGADDAISVVRKLLGDADNTITYISAETVQTRIEPQMRPWKLGASVFAVFGLLALVVAAIGIYSVMSYLIAGRRHEIGVRLALGAKATDVMRLVFRGSLLMSVIGIAIGELVAASLAELVQPLLFGTSAHDPFVFAAVALVLVTVAILATLGPAARARRISAMEALRAE